MKIENVKEILEKAQAIYNGRALYVKKIERCQIIGYKLSSDCQLIRDSYHNITMQGNMYPFTNDDPSIFFADNQKLVKELLSHNIDVFIDIELLKVSILFIKDEDVERCIELVKIFTAFILLYNDISESLKDVEFGYHIVKEKEEGSYKFNKKLHVFKNKGVPKGSKYSNYNETTRHIMIESKKKYTIADYERLFEHMTRSLFGGPSSNLRDMVLKIYPLTPSTWNVEINIPQDYQLTQHIIQKGSDCIHNFIKDYLTNVSHSGISVKFMSVIPDNEKGIESLQKTINLINTYSDKLILDTMGAISDELVESKELNIMGDAKVLYNGPINKIEGYSFPDSVKEFIPQIFFSRAANYTIDNNDSIMCNINVTINENIAEELNLQGQFSNVLTGVHNKMDINTNTAAELIIYVLGAQLNAMSATGDIIMELKSPVERIFVNIDIE